MAKLMGFQYEIIYKAGKENSVADALSRQHEWAINSSGLDRSGGYRRGNSTGFISAEGR